MNRFAKLLSQEPAALQLTLSIFFCVISIILQLAAMFSIKNRDLVMVTTTIVTMNGVGFLYIGGLLALNKRKDK